MQTTLNGVAKHWTIFVEAIVARENLASWDRLLDYFVQEKTRRGPVQGDSYTSWEDEENLALTSKGNNKFNKGPKKGADKQQDGHQKDFRIVK